jgi:cell filamentation protein
MDPYVYPGTSVLKNLRDLRDAEDLARFEANMAVRRGVELEAGELTGRLDVAHLQAIHRYLFQDVYPWAGEFRTVNISRSGQYPFAFAEQIVNCLQKLAADLAREEHLSQLPLEAFCRRGAYYFGELNAIHPFRDGNGRSQREFVRQLAARNGFRVRWSRVDRPQMTAASRLSFQSADNSGFEEILRSCCV